MGSGLNGRRDQGGRDHLRGLRPSVDGRSPAGVERGAEHDHAWSPSLHGGGYDAVVQVVSLSDHSSRLGRRRPLTPPSLVRAVSHPLSHKAIVRLSNPCGCPRRQIHAAIAPSAHQPGTEAIVSDTADPGTIGATALSPRQSRDARPPEDEKRSCATCAVSAPSRARFTSAQMPVAKRTRVCCRTVQPAAAGSPRKEKLGGWLPRRLRALRVRDCSSVVPPDQSAQIAQGSSVALTAPSRSLREPPSSECRVSR